LIKEGGEVAMLALSSIGIVLAAIACAAVALSWVSLIRIKQRVDRLEQKDPSQKVRSKGAFRGFEEPLS
jgi:hypothetical protein